MKLSTKISGSVSLFLVAAMLISTAVFVMQGYTNFRNDIRNEAETSLDLFQAIHIQAMLNRGTDLDNDPVIATFNATMEQISKNADGLSLWVAMGPKVIDYQQRMGHGEIERPRDDVDRETLRDAIAVERLTGTEIFRLSIPMVLGQGDADNDKCFQCHGKLMGMERGDVIGIYSIALSVSELWADFKGVVKTAIITTITVLILISGISVYLLNRMTSGPINRMIKVMGRLADGDTQVEIRDLDREDEISEMAKALEVFKENAVELNFQKFALDEHAIVSSTDVKGDITYVNDKFCEISGYPREELLGHNHRMLVSDEHSTEFYKDLWQTITHGKTWHGNIKNLRKDGSHYWVKATIVPFLNDQGKPFEYVSIRTDITEQKQAEQLKVLAHHDALTGLPNRNLFGDRLGLAIAQAKRLKGEFAILYLDLDNFKPINDTLGHDVGDVVLQEVGRRLKESVRETDTIARIGGDEFAVILVAPVPTEISLRTAKKILTALSKPISVKGYDDCVIGASIGISIYPRDANDAETIVKCADTAMYKAKRSGRGDICFYGNDPA